MKERPILFSAPMVRALLDGSKTQTRRVLKQATGPSLSVGIEDEPGVAELSWLSGDGPGHDVHETIRKVPCPYGQPGDRLWVRENFSGPHCMEASEGCAAVPPGKWAQCSSIWYWADGEPGYGDWTRPRPSIHMPRWASRISLEIVGVRVERLQDISEADARAEGITLHPDHHDKPHDSIYGPVQTYRDLWESLNGPNSWAANPWVWVVEFKVVDHE